MLKVEFRTSVVLLFSVDKPGVCPTLAYRETQMRQQQLVDEDSYDPDNGLQEGELLSEGSDPNDHDSYDVSITSNVHII